MKGSKTLIITGIFTLLVVLAICYYALMQFAQEKYSIVLKDSSLEIVDFSIEDKEELWSRHHLHRLSEYLCILSYQRSQRIQYVHSDKVYR